MAGPMLIELGILSQGVFSTGMLAYLATCSAGLLVMLGSAIDNIMIDERASLKQCLAKTLAKLSFPEVNEALSLLPETKDIIKDIAKINPTITDNLASLPEGQPQNPPPLPPANK